MTRQKSIFAAVLTAVIAASALSGCVSADSLNKRLDALESRLAGSGPDGGPVSSAESSPAAESQTAAETAQPETETAPEPVPDPEPASEVPDVSALIASNRLPDLLLDGKIVKRTSQVFDTPEFHTYYVMKGGDFVILDDHGELSGFCRGLNFRHDDGGRTVFFSYYLGEYADAMRENYENHISGVFDYYNDLTVTEYDETSAHVYGYLDEGHLTYELNADFSLPDGMMTKTVTETKTSEGNLYRSELYYEKISLSDIPDELRSFLDELDSETKQVTYGYYLDDGTLVKGTFTVPSGWAYQAGEDGYWMDEECSIPYEYPGDGVDYTLIFNPAKG